MSRRPGNKLDIDYDTVVLIKKMLVEGDMQLDIAEEADVSAGFVSNVKSGRSYPNVPWPNGEIGSYHDAYPEMKEAFTTRNQDIVDEVVESLLRAVRRELRRRLTDDKSLNVLRRMLQTKR